MLVSAKIAKAPSVERLLHLWMERYTPNLSLLTPARDPWILSDIVESTLPEGRATTVTKLHELLDNCNCDFLHTTAKSLHGYMPGILDFDEASHLTELASQVYMEVLKHYQYAAAIEASPINKLWALTSRASSGASHQAWGIPNIPTLTLTLEPSLLDLQKQHIALLDWRTLGFMTTVLNLIATQLLQQLTLVEQVLITPYFKFVEEQIALPWQRLCAAADKHSLDAPRFMLVEQMMPASPDIAQTVYCRLMHLFPKHCSRRGTLNQPEVMHSCLRDLEMFQSYLWLCILEDSLQPVTQELVTLCVMVMQSVGVKWELIAQWNQLLLDEIVRRVTPEQKALLLPYIEGMQQAFYVKRWRLGAIL